MASASDLPPGPVSMIRSGNMMYQSLILILGCCLLVPQIGILIFMPSNLAVHSVQLQYPGFSSMGAFTSIS